MSTMRTVCAGFVVDVFEPASGDASGLAPSPADHTRARLVRMRETAELDARLSEAE